MQNSLHVISHWLIGLCFIAGSGSVFAAPTACSVTIHSDDQIRWDVPRLEVSKSCETFTVTLMHDGKLHNDVMGHNWVLTKASDKKAVANAMASAKKTDFIKDDARIIAYTRLIGGGEQTNVTFEVSKLKVGETYRYFCSYPEHSQLMQGTLILVD